MEKRENKNFGLIIIGLTVASLFIYNFFKSDNKKEKHNTDDNPAVYYVIKEAVCTYSEDDFETLSSCVYNNDDECLKELYLNNKILKIPAGTKVYVEDAGLVKCLVRLNGSSQKIWIQRKRLSKDY